MGKKNNEQDEEDARLLEAARAGDTKEAQKWLDAEEDLDGDGLGADVNAKEPGDDGMSSLMLACQNCHIACAELLIKYGASVDAKSGFKKPDKKKDPYTGRWRTALHFAAEAGDAAIVSLLLDQTAGLHMPDKEGNTPFMLATGAAKDVLQKAHKEELFHMNATEGNVEALEALLEDGWAENIPGNEDVESSRQLLMRASGDNGAAVDALLSSPTPPGVFIGCVNGWGENALHFACGAGNTAAVQMLLPLLRDQSPTSVEQPTKAKEVPLHFAAMKGVCIARSLASRPRLMPSRSMTSRISSLISAQSLMQSPRSLRTLANPTRYLVSTLACTSPRCRPSSPTSTRPPFSPLSPSQHCAAAEELLVSDDLFARWEGVEVNVQNEFGFSSLALAAKYGHTAMVRLLLSYGAAIDARNVDGFTGLILASEAGHVPMVRRAASHPAHRALSKGHWPYARSTQCTDGAPCTLCNRSGSSRPTVRTSNARWIGGRRRSTTRATTATRRSWPSSTTRSTSTPSCVRSRGEEEGECGGGHEEANEKGK